MPNGLYGKDGNINDLLLWKSLLFNKINFFIFYYLYNINTWLTWINFIAKATQMLESNKSKTESKDKPELTVRIT